MTGLAVLQTVHRQVRLHMLDVGPTWLVLLVLVLIVLAGVAAVVWLVRHGSRPTG